MDKLSFELFEQIIKELATTHGVYSAWQLRTPVSAFFQTFGAEQILRRNLHLYLEYHSTQPGTTSGDLPYMVDAVTNLILTFVALDAESAAQEQTIRARVSQSFGKHAYNQHTWHKNVTDFHYSPRRRQRTILEVPADEDPMHYALCTAIDWEDADLVAYLVNNGASMWSTSQVFRSPMYAAFNFRTVSLQMVRSVAAYTRAESSPPEEQRVKNVAEDILAQCEYRYHRDRRAKPSCPQMAKELTRWAAPHFSLLDDQLQDLLCVWANEHQDVQFLRQVIQDGPVELRQRLVWPYFAFPPNLAILALLVKEGILRTGIMYRTNKHNIGYKQQETCFLPKPASIWEADLKGFHVGKCSAGSKDPKWDCKTSVVDHALLHGDGAAVRLALKLGAPHNGVCLPYPLTWDRLYPDSASKFPVTRTRVWREIKLVLEGYESDATATALRRSGRIKK
ncbi:hypothetical protein M011DRAFT_455315 [Sporormia fimetaria CBS 119925]|uniref:Uncharacterized protein n=1 Tax=Sporormia fimetaria CBS 119925 TaxID=1340428 RepID=A0A6A6VKZ9_9PLEO|nr:hypothetical protein M011DRAFT_455315 [Sporormia fimetaria CBS 119925]